MAITFTPQQQKVIDLHDRNILVSAAAGSGKTAVLVERIIQMICREENPVDIDRLLIVTFTNAAAAEMRERISLGINRQLALNPRSEHIQRQAALIYNAQITTIDSFCMFLLRNHFHEVSVDPAFRVMDEGEKKLFCQDVMAQLMEEKFASGDVAFHHCVEYFCPGGKEKVLEEYILSLYEFAESYPWPVEWLKERKKDYVPVTEEELEQTDYGQYLMYHIRHMLEGCLTIYRRIQKLCQMPDGPYMYGELVDQELDMIERLLSSDSLTQYAQRIPAAVFGRLSTKKDDTVSPQKRELAKVLRGQVKDMIKDLGEKLFATPLELAAAQSSKCAEPVKMLIDLTLEFRCKLQEKKQDAKLVDFSDMEHYALDILLTRENGVIVPSQVALEYRQHFAEVLIDEYQDSNLVQEYLLKAVSGEEDGCFNRFMVGDVKQSIYKFRLARPELFLEKYDTYSQEDSTCQRIDLSKNFRSRQEVVDTVNGIFSGIMTRQTGGIDYDERAMLYPGANYPENPGCRSELILVEKTGGEELTDVLLANAGEAADQDKHAKTALTPKQLEAHAIAARMKELTASFKVTDKESGELRPVRYSDMVILLRSNSGWDEEFKRILEEEGIPVYITSKTGYFAAVEVQELLQLLRVLDNPRQDVTLFGVMKSVFGGFTEEEIAMLRSAHKEGSLYEALKWAGNASMGEGDHMSKAGDQVPKATGIMPEAAAIVPKATVEISDALRKKTADFLAKINRYRGYTSYMPIRELLKELVSENDYLAYVTALPMGSRRKANVEMLFTKASDFEKTSYHGLFHFIRYIEQLEKYDVDYGEADFLDENADVVRIMSIHKSKGLEFPVTFVAGLSKRFNMQDVNKALIVDVDLGIGTDFMDVERRIRNKTLRRLALSRKMKEDNLAEELRVLYVALTRAKEKLIMTGVLEDAENSLARRLENSLGSLQYHEFMESAGMLDFVLPMVGQAALDVKFWDASCLPAGHNREQIHMLDRRKRLECASSYADAQALKKVRERFRYRYPHEALENLYTKTTVSELKIAAMAEKDEAAFHAFEEQEVVPYIPKFKRTEEKISGAVRGDAFHKVMELMNFERIYQGLFTELPQSVHAFEQIMVLKKDQVKRNLHKFLENTVQSGRLSQEYREAVNDNKLVNFLISGLGYRMHRASLKGLLYREQPFVYGISASRLGEDFPAEEKVLIQGIIDAYFVEDGELVLVDYKTDVIGSPKELWNRYATQVEYYEEALCHLTAMPMKQKILYSFYLEQCVEDCNISEKELL